MPRILLIYRRSDPHPSVMRAVETLVTQFGPQAFVTGLERTSVGQGLREAAERELRDADAVFILIGPEFAGQTDNLGRPRLDNPDDPVRLLTEAALKRKRHHISVLLLGGVSMPRDDQMPPSMRALPMYGTVSIRDSAFEADFKPILVGVGRIVGGAQRRMVRFMWLFFALIVGGSFLLVLLLSLAEAT